MATLVKHFSDVTGKWERCTSTNGRCPYGNHRADINSFNKQLDDVFTANTPSDEDLAAFMSSPIVTPVSNGNGNRGSTGAHASLQKQNGHDREDIVAGLLPSATVLGGTIKADISYFDDGKMVNASIKGGNKWQLMLYGKNRLTETDSGKNDEDFINGRNSDMSDFLTREIDAFPEDWDTYFADKTEAKKLLLQMPQEEVYNKLGENNTYISSKMKLQKVTEEFAANLNDKANLRKFLEKSMFDNDSCQKFIVVKNNKVHIFEKQHVLDTLTSALSADVSNAGRRKDDYNVQGQKVILKADFKTRPTKNNPEGSVKTNNVLEVEIRNDSEQHYREVRLNLLGAKAFALLTQPTSDGMKPYKVIDIPQDKQSAATK